MARVYADVNQNLPRSYWDYDSVNISKLPDHGLSWKQAPYFAVAVSGTDMVRSWRMAERRMHDEILKHIRLKAASNQETRMSSRYSTCLSSSYFGTACGPTIFLTVHQSRLSSGFLPSVLVLS